MVPGGAILFVQYIGKIGKWILLILTVQLTKYQ